MVRLKGGKGGKVVSLGKGEVGDFEKVGNVEGWSRGSWFFQRLGMHSEPKISSLCF